MNKRKWLAIVLALAMVLTMMPAMALADDLSAFEPVDASRISTYTVTGVSADVTDAKVVFTVDSKTDTSNWEQDSGEGSVQTYTYVGVYVNAPTDYASLKINGEGDPSDMSEVTEAFLQGDKYQHWIPVAVYENDKFILFNGSRDYKLLLEWTMKDGSTQKEYVDITRNLSTELENAIVAKNGSKTYETLKDAVAGAQDGDTVTLMNDASGSGIVIDTSKYATKGLTIDFNNHTYTVNEEPLAGSSGTESQCFQLLTGGSVTMKNGTIKADNRHVAMLIQNYCNLTLSGMKLEGNTMTRTDTYALSNNCGNVKIVDTTITAKEGEVAFDVYGGFKSYGDVTVTVSGNSVINGKIEVAREKNKSNDNTNTLNIEGGTLNGDLEVKTTDDGFATEVNISGGTFTKVCPFLRQMASK